MFGLKKTPPPEIPFGPVTVVDSTGRKHQWCEAKLCIFYPYHRSGYDAWVEPRTGQKMTFPNPAGYSGPAKIIAP